jgi:hypothetical protein
VESVPQTGTRTVTEFVDGTPVARQVTYTFMTRRQYSVLKVFDTATGKEVVTHVGASGLALFCPGSGHIASAAGRPAFAAPHHGGGIIAPLEDAPPPVPDGMPDPHGLAPVDTALYVFDLKTGKQTHRFHGHAGQITALAFTPDCRKLASGSYGVGAYDGDPPGKHFAQVNIWDLEANKMFQMIAGHTGAINCLEFDPAGKRLASASDDATAKVWRVEGSLNTTPVLAAPMSPRHHGPVAVPQGAAPAPVISGPVPRVPAIK